MSKKSLLLESIRNGIGQQRNALNTENTWILLQTLNFYLKSEIQFQISDSAFILIFLIMTNQCPHSISVPTRSVSPFSMITIFQSSQTLLYKEF